MSRNSLPSFLVTLFLAGIPFVLLSVENKRSALYESMFALPYLLALLVGFLGEKLNQRRVLFAAFALGVSCAYLCLDLPQNFSSHLRGAKGQILAVTLPVMLFISFTLKESWLRGLTVVGWLLLVLLPLAISHFAYGQPGSHWLYQTRFRDGFFFSHLSNAGVFMAMLFAALAYQTDDRYVRVFRYYVAVSLLPLFYIFERSGMRFASAEQFQLEVSLSFISAAAILIYANFYLYWQKVYVDELTGIPNRRALNERLITLKHFYTVAMVDIDHFKHFNDQYGHEQGDSVLRFVSKHFASQTRGEVYRYGGEEFCIIFRKQTTADALPVVERLRDLLSRRDFYIRSSERARKETSRWDRQTEVPKGLKTAVTVSIGLAHSKSSHSRPEDVIKAADEALYEAKQHGRNRVVAA